MSPPQETKAEVKVTLPGGKICKVFVPKESSTPAVYQVRLIDHLVQQLVCFYLSRLLLRRLVSVKVTCDSFHCSECMIITFVSLLLHDNVHELLCVNRFQTRTKGVSPSDISIPGGFVITQMAVFCCPCELPSLCAL